MADLKTFLEQKYSVWFHRIGFWFLIIFLIGFISGVFFIQKMVIEPRLRDSVTLGGVVIDKKPYDIKLRL